MGRWFLLALVGILVFVVGLAVLGDFDGWRDHRRTEVGQVVTTADGETMVVFDDGGGWHGPPVGVFFFPFFWILLIGGAIWFFRANRWSGGPPDRQDREEWFDHWHRRAHESDSNGQPDRRPDA